MEEANTTKKRPYQYRYRPYDSRENQIREDSRKRKNRKQLCFTQEELDLISQNMESLGIDNFSFYMRAVACYGHISIEEIRERQEELS